MSRYFIDKDGTKDPSEEQQAKDEFEKERRGQLIQEATKRVEERKNVKKFKRGRSFNTKKACMHTKYRKKLDIHADRIKETIDFTARSEFLLPESSGFLEADDNEKTYQVPQKEIVQNVDITSATKQFDLNLNFGPYMIDYYRNGRKLLLGGRLGHVAAIDWLTKDLLCEFNVRESIHDVCWLHMPTLFAVAQKDWVYIYDHQGVENHCLKKLFRTKFMTFLPYHFLLVTANESSNMTWTDVSMGKVVSSYRPPKSKVITAMKQNPHNAVTVTGHANGTVSMWTPNDKEPVVKMLCHPAPVTDLAIESSGIHMITVSNDRSMKVWDLRNYKCMKNYKLKAPATKIDFSQRGLVSLAMGNVVEIYKDCCTTTVEEPYLRHRLDKFATDVHFCNYEDVLGVGHGSGFTSLLVPGAGEANFDAFESNPFMTTSQRKEMEVKQLLEKIQPELISLDPIDIGRVNVDKLKEEQERRSKLLYVKPKLVEFESRKKLKTAKKVKVKQAIKDESKREFIQEVVKGKQREQRTKQLQQDSQGGSNAKSNPEPLSVLSRFWRK